MLAAWAAGPRNPARSPAYRRRRTQKANDATRNADGSECAVCAAAPLAVRACRIRIHNQTSQSPPPCAAAPLAVRGSQTRTNNLTSQSPPRERRTPVSRAAQRGKPNDAGPEAGPRPCGAIIKRMQRPAHGATTAGSTRFSAPIGAPVAVVFLITTPVFPLALVLPTIVSQLPAMQPETTQCATATARGSRDAAPESPSAFLPPSTPTPSQTPSPPASGSPPANTSPVPTRNAAGRQRSWVWRYFVKADDYASSFNTTCTRCRANLKASRGSTSTMAAHLVKTHGITHDPDDVESLGMSGSNPQPPVCEDLIWAQKATRTAGIACHSGGPCMREVGILTHTWRNRRG